MDTEGIIVSWLLALDRKEAVELTAELPAAWGNFLALWL
jgi:hypothetical protein